MDGKKNRLKHVERLTEIKKLRNVASFLVVPCEYPFRTFRVTAFRTALAAIPVCGESGSHPFQLMLRFYSPYLKKVLEVMFPAARRHRSNKHVHYTSKFYK